MAVSKPTNVNAFIVVDDVEKTANFWKENFGAKVPQTMKAPDGTTVHAGVEYGKTYIMFGPAAMAPPGTSEREWKEWTSKPRYNGVNLYINVKNVAAVYKKAKSAGAHIEEELGDVLYVVANLARRLKIDPEQALQGTNRKFDRRFRHMEAAATSQGRRLEDLSLDEMEALWQKAKEAGRSQG